MWVRVFPWARLWVWAWVSFGAGVDVGTGVGASRRGSGFGIVGPEVLSFFFELVFF